MLCRLDEVDPANWSKEQVAEFLTSVASSSKWVRTLVTFVLEEEVEGATFATCFTDVDGSRRTDPVTGLLDIFAECGLAGPLAKARLRAVAVQYWRLQGTGAVRCLH